MTFTTLRQYSPPVWVLLTIQLPAALLATSLVAIAGEGLLLAIRRLLGPVAALDRVDDFAPPFSLFCGFLGAVLLARLAPSLVRSGRWVFLLAATILFPEFISEYREIFLLGLGTRLHKIAAFADDDSVLIACLYLGYSLCMVLIERRVPSGVHGEQ